MTRGVNVDRMRRYNAGKRRRGTSRVILVPHISPDPPPPISWTFDAVVPNPAAVEHFIGPDCICEQIPPGELHYGGIKPRPDCPTHRYLFSDGVPLTPTRVLHTRGTDAPGTPS